MKRALAALVVLGALATPASAASAPKSCATALTQADQMRGLVVEHGTALSAYFDELYKASQRVTAGSIVSFTTFLNDQTAAMNTLTAKTKDITARLTPIASTYGTAAAKCRKGK